MMSRRAKEAYFRVAGPLMHLNGLLYRRFRAPREGSLRVHLGPGRGGYIAGWLNLDANRFTARCDLWADLRRSLPFHDGTVECFYSHHVVEHLPDPAAHLRETFRCLKPGGAYRLGGPDGDAAIARFVAGDADWFPDFPDRRSSLGGRLENFLLCRGEHRTILTFSYLEELLTAAGFVEIQPRRPARETGHPALFAPCLAREEEGGSEALHTLIVEAVKPRGPAPSG